MVGDILGSDRVPTRFSSRVRPFGCLGPWLCELCDATEVDLCGFRCKLSTVGFVCEEALFVESVIDKKLCL